MLEDFDFELEGKLKISKQSEESEDSGIKVPNSLHLLCCLVLDADVSHVN